MQCKHDIFGAKHSNCIIHCSSLGSEGVIHCSSLGSEGVIHCSSLGSEGVIHCSSLGSEGVIHCSSLGSEGVRMYIVYIVILYDFVITRLDHVPLIRARN